MVGGNGNREKGAKSEFNGRTNMGLLENGLELGFFRLLLERYVVDVSGQQATIKYLHLVYHSS